MRLTPSKGNLLRRLKGQTVFELMSSPPEDYEMIHWLVELESEGLIEWVNTDDDIGYRRTPAGDAAVREMEGK